MSYFLLMFFVLFLCLYGRYLVGIIPCWSGHFTGKLNNVKPRHNLEGNMHKSYVINRPGVAGAVLQTALSKIK